MPMNRAECNALRFRGDGRGHYESYFQRANHPTRKLGFWIRYTIFEPAGRANAAVGELWAIWFDGESNRIVPVKTVVPLAECEFDRTRLRARIAESVLDERSLRGRADAHGHSIEWSLEYASPAEPLLLFPERLYDAPLPKAKVLVGSPLADFSGSIVVDGTTHDVSHWIGSQNHNWGSRHTDEYAWGQVAGFDGHTASFLELATARVRIGPFRSPWISPIVLRHEGRELRFDSVATSIRAKAAYEPFHWKFTSEADGFRIDGSIEAEADSFVGLLYDNPPGGRKVCLNSKIASCTIRVAGPDMKPFTLTSRHRAAFEILRDARHPSVPTLEV